MGDPTQCALLGLAAPEALCGSMVNSHAEKAADVKEFMQEEGLLVEAGDDRDDLEKALAELENEV
eukprot:9399256-Karenia_brevis.AAC.1